MPCYIKAKVSFLVVLFLFFKNYVYESIFAYLESLLRKLLDSESSHLTKHNRHFVSLLDGVFRELILSGCDLYHRSVLWM